MIQNLEITFNNNFPRICRCIVAFMLCQSTLTMIALLFYFCSLPPPTLNSSANITSSFSLIASPLLRISRHTWERKWFSINSSPRARPLYKVYNKKNAGEKGRKEGTHLNENFRETLKNNVHSRLLCIRRKYREGVNERRLSMQFHRLIVERGVTHEPVSPHACDI